MGGTRNTLEDLNNHLFMQLERLGDEDVKGKKLQEEIIRAKAITALATQVISNGSLVLKAHTLMRENALFNSTVGSDSNENSKPFKLPRQLRAEFLRE